MTDESRTQLIATARKAAANAYAPYSGLKVGAAILSESGETFTGANVENASYSLSQCAERVALQGLVGAGAGAPVAVAIVALDAGGEERDAPPCGACRQALFEFAPRMDVIYRHAGEPASRRLAELLPDPFGGEEDGGV